MAREWYQKAAAAGNALAMNNSRLSTGQKPVAVFLNDFFSDTVPANLERIAPTRCTIDATLDQAGQTYHVKSEQPGMGVFYKDGNGDVIHTYSCYARGLDILIGAYNFLGLTPKGRNERG
ncbi:MAG: DUF899 family protein [Chthoniobacterales bacterium]